jgi:hypothetical protein
MAAKVAPGVCGSDPGSRYVASFMGISHHTAGPDGTDGVSL